MSEIQQKEAGATSSELDEMVAAADTGGRSPSNYNRRQHHRRADGEYRSHRALFYGPPMATGHGRSREPLRASASHR